MWEEGEALEIPKKIMGLPRLLLKQLTIAGQKDAFPQVVQVTLRMWFPQAATTCCDGFKVMQLTPEFSLNLKVSPIN